MDAWIDIRRKARECHNKALTKTNGDHRAQSIVDAALHIDSLQTRLCDFAPGTLGSLDRSARLVNIAKNQQPADELVVIAHEIGHFHLHLDPINEVTVRAHGLGGDPIDSGAGKVEGYSPRERKEVQADIFAGEFLCPSDWLREELVAKKKRPSTVAAEIGLPLQLVLHQAIRALLLPPIRPAPLKPETIPLDLDESQAAAAIWDEGPLLVDAGPGTGKTRTLVRRIGQLLDKGARSVDFLALTFSNKAAEEMRERLSSMNVDAAIEMWVSTFHAFGLELLTKWPLSVGRTAKVKILDQTGSLELLEANLDKLPLRHFQNLYEPAYELVPVLRVISRCKDDLISHQDYRAAAEAAMAAVDPKQADAEDALEAAEKMLEIAEIYRIYEAELECADAVDFGDLVRYAAQLVRTNPDVQAHVAHFKHILVDEYQDVNFASAELLRELSKSGADIWVVADQRQSIYRFRGAEPTNVAAFPAAFKGTRLALANNYRSFAPVVQAVERFSASMSGGSLSGKWKPIRGAGGAATLTVAPNVAAEGEAIREKIEELRKLGIPYGEQAVLARSHLTLARITEVLEQLGVPLLYLGDLFERPEIRDLLSLVALDAEFGAIGLVRVAALPEYRVPTEDALATIRWSLENKVTIFGALVRIQDIPALSEGGRAGLLKLGEQLSGLEHASPWTLLTAWLFERSDYLTVVLNGNHAIAQQKLVAIYQLLKVCGEYAALGNSSRKRFLERIRRIEALNEDTAYRAVSSEASDMEAVRVMTIHGSKGLEFTAVHLPAIATTYMPSNWRGVRIVPPPTLSRLAMRKDGHEAEEECLFFVGLSRARDYLSLSRAEKYTAGRSAGASKFLNALTGTIPMRQFPGSGKTYTPTPDLIPQPAKAAYTERELELYRQCPARYRYEFIDGLRGSRDESAYLNFHRCVYRAVGWAEEERQKGRTVDAAAALAKLAVIWVTDGPLGHPFEKYYRSTAEAMVAEMARAIAAETGRYERMEWTIPIGGRNILITPDRVLVADDGSIRVQRIRTGRQTKSESDKPIYALMRRGAAAKYPGRRISIEALYLATGAAVPMPPKNDEKLLGQYADAIAGIERGDFHAEPDVRRCPNCQCYFICES